ncbi:unnamed protein product [Mortierella alpina]
MKTSVALIALIYFVAGALALPTETCIPSGIEGKIVMAIGPQLCIEDQDGVRSRGNPVRLADWDFDASKQQWEFENGHIELSPSRARNDTDRFCLDIMTYTGKNSLNLIVNPCSGSSSQMWECISDVDKINFKLKNLALDRCLEATKGSEEKDRKLTLAECTEQDNQQWTFIE